MVNDKVAATVHPRKPCSCFQRDPKMGPWHYEGCAYYQALPEETTGERIWDKLTGGSEYATVTVRDAEGRVVQEDQIPFEHVGHGSLQYDPARDSAGVVGSESLQVRQKRDWSPTKGELAVAMGIVLFIIAIFVFVVTYYKL